MMCPLQGGSGPSSFQESWKHLPPLTPRTQRPLPCIVTLAASPELWDHSSQQCWRAIVTWRGQRQTLPRAPPPPRLKPPHSVLRQTESPSAPLPSPVLLHPRQASPHLPPHPSPHPSPPKPSNHPPAPPHRQSLAQVMRPSRLTDVAGSTISGQVHGSPLSAPVELLGTLAPGSHLGAPCCDVLQVNWLRRGLQEGAPPSPSQDRCDWDPK